MPICICPECSKPHKIPAKNLGLKGRCTQCRAIFSLVENKPEPSPAPTPEFVPPPPPEPDPEPEFEADTFSLRLPEPPAPPVLPQPSEPKEASDAWMDDLDFDEDDAPDASKGRKPGPRGEVASLPKRPALTIVATVYTVVGCFFLLIAVGTCVVGVLALSRAVTPQQSAMAATFVASLIPVFVACVMGAVSCIAFGEAIHWGIAIEARLHEISKNVSR